MRNRMSAGRWLGLALLLACGDDPGIGSQGDEGPDPFPDVVVADPGQEPEDPGPEPTDPAEAADPGVEDVPPDPGPGDPGPADPGQTPDPGPGDPGQTPDPGPADAGPQPGDPPTMGPAIPVANGFYSSLGVLSAAVDSTGRVSVLWGKDGPGGPGTELMLSRSNAEVTSFDEAQVVTAWDSGFAQLWGDVLAIESEQLILWRHRPEEPGTNEVRFRRAELPALAGDDVVVGSAGSSTSMLRPYLVRAGLDDLFAIWEHGKSLAVARSVDGGATWTTPVNLPTAGGAPVSDAVYIAPGRLVIAYQGDVAGIADQTILVVTSDDGGQTFSAPLHVAAGTPAGSLHYPTVAFGPASNPFVAWHRKEPDAWLATSADGLAWDEPVLLPIATTSVILRAGKGETLYLSGLDTAAIAGGTLAFLVTPDAGATWWDPGFAPSTDGYIILPTYEVVADRKKGLLHAVWWELETGPGDTFPCTFNCSQLRLATVGP